MRYSTAISSVGLCIALGLAPGCSSSSSDPKAITADLAVTNISVLEDSLWALNRSIDITFDQPIDFRTVSGNTLQITDASGVAAVGVFLQPRDLLGNVQDHVVRFQPNCPIEDDYSDSGFARGTEYQLRIIGSEDGLGSYTVQSQQGGPLRQGLTVRFQTPDSNLPGDLFLDPVPGPPTIRVRGQANVTNNSMEASYLEIGGDPDNRHYFNGIDLGGFVVPLNKYSEPDSQVAVMLHINQPVLASSANLQTGRVGMEYWVPQESAWLPIHTRVSLAENCIETGSILRVEPLGLLPQGSQIRVVVRQGFSDLSGDTTPQDNTSLDVMRSKAILDVAGNPAEDSDELLEHFILSGDAPSSWEDTETPLGNPRAHWGLDGKLEAAFDFAGTGGPGGDFDYHVPAGETVSIDTTTATIVGGPGGAPVRSQLILNGVMDVRNLVVPATSRLVFVGPNPVSILASGSVTIEGSISCNGGNNDGVGTLDTTFQPEPGAAGNAGGGKGGLASFLTSASTPRGGTGHGAFNQAGKGGQGGEAGYSSAGIDSRRGAGGGGGALGRDVFYDHDINVTGDPLRHCQTLIGMDGEPGFDGPLNGTGAVSQTERARGGAMGPGPFVDSDDDNDFFGTQLSADGNLIAGELESVWAGAGGGGGGDASDTNVYPSIPFLSTGDEKGGGGGGGAGGIAILAIGPIVVEDGGQVLAIGGYGGAGENTFGHDRVGGAGGGGSGGHVVLSSASFINVKGIALAAGDGYRDLTAHRIRPVSALGGQGGAGHDERGGADSTGPTLWRCDAIDLDRLRALPGSSDVPPLEGNTTCFSENGMPDYEADGGPVFGAGGDGTPGIIQFHVDDPALNIRFDGIAQGTTWVDGDLTKACAPPPLGWYGPGVPTDDFLAFFGRQSIAQSKWIPLGLARVAPEGAPDEQVRFFFGGTDPQTGSVLRSTTGAGDTTAVLTDVIPEDTLSAAGTLPYAASGGDAIFFDGSGLDPAYQANPRILQGFLIVLKDNNREATFPVATAVWNEDDALKVTVSGGSNLDSEFIQTASGPVRASLRPQFFALSTSGIAHSFPQDMDVKIMFDAAVLDSQGRPVASSSYSVVNGEFATDVNELNLDQWDVCRFRVSFDLDTQGVGVVPGTPKPAIQFLRMPFVY